METRVVNFVEERRRVISNRSLIYYSRRFWHHWRDRRDFSVGNKKVGMLGLGSAIQVSLI